MYELKKIALIMFSPILFDSPFHFCFFFFFSSSVIFDFAEQNNALCTTLQKYSSTVAVAVAAQRSAVQESTAWSSAPLPPTNTLPRTKEPQFLNGRDTNRVSGPIPHPSYSSQYSPFDRTGLRARMYPLGLQPSNFFAS